MQQPQIEIEEFYTETKNGIVQRIGKSVIMQPEIKYNGKGIKWFDDSKLLKTKDDKAC